MVRSRETPFRSEVMIQAGDSEIFSPGQGHGTPKSQSIQFIAFTAEISAHPWSPFRLEGPQGLHRGTDSQLTRIKRRTRTRINRSGDQGSNGSRARGVEGRTRI